MIHFTSDLHFGHANIIRFCQRPFSSKEEMDEAIIDNWNKVVKPTDTVFNLGDLAFCELDKLTSILDRLNGNHQLILGNHDKIVTKNKKYLLDNGFLNGVHNYYELKLDRQLIILFHYGQRVWNKSHHGSIHLYGHSHSTLPPYGKSVDVGIDCKEITSEYRPISLDEVMEYMKHRTFESVDHHGKDL